MADLAPPEKDRKAASYVMHTPAKAGAMPEAKDEAKTPFSHYATELGGGADAGFKSPLHFAREHFGPGPELNRADKPAPTSIYRDGGGAADWATKNRVAPLAPSPQPQGGIYGPFGDWTATQGQGTSTLFYDAGNIAGEKIISAANPQGERRSGQALSAGPAPENLGGGGAAITAATLTFGGGGGGGGGSGKATSQAWRSIWS
jgi:hypothetical protein